MAVEVQLWQAALVDYAQVGRLAGGEVAGGVVGEGREAGVGVADGGITGKVADYKYAYCLATQ